MARIRGRSVQIAILLWWLLAWIAHQASFRLVKANLIRGRIEMEAQYWYVIFLCTTFVIPGIILLADDGNFKRKG